MDLKKKKLRTRIDSLILFHKTNRLKPRLGVGLLFLSRPKSLIYDMRVILNSKEGFYAIYNLMKKGYTLEEAINQVKEENARKS